MPETADDRLMQLERIAADQDKVIAELSAEVASQWTAIERLQKKLESLAGRFGAMEEQMAPDVPNTRPPHW